MSFPLSLRKVALERIDTQTGNFVQGLCESNPNRTSDSIALALTLFFARLSIFKLVGGWMEPLQTEKEGRGADCKLSAETANFAF